MFMSLTGERKLKPQPSKRVDSDVNETKEECCEPHAFLFGRCVWIKRHAHRLTSATNVLISLGMGHILLFSYILLTIFYGAAYGETTLSQIEAFIAKQRAETGMPPSEDTFLEFLQSAKAGLSPQVWTDGWNLWRDSQTTDISTANLAELIEAKRDSIYDVYTKYQVSHKPLIKAPGLKEWQQGSEFAADGDKLFLKTDREATPEEPPFKRSSSYDGKLVRIFQIYSDIESRGTIENLQSRRVFHNTDGPLGMSMLIDTERELGRVWLVHDLVAYLKDEAAVVHQHTDEVGGTQCIVVGFGMPSLWRVYLDPERNYAVLKFEQYDNIYNEDGVIVESRTLETNWTCEDLEDHGNGIWLPNKITHEWLATKPDKGMSVGTIRSQRITQAQKIAVNQGVDDKTFTDIFPNGVRVWDTIKNVTYYVGGGRSIDEVIDEFLKDDFANTKGETIPAPEVKLDTPQPPIEQARTQEKEVRQPLEGKGKNKSNRKVVWFIITLIGVIAVIVITILYCRRQGVYLSLKCSKIILFLLSIVLIIIMCQVETQGSTGIPNHAGIADIKYAKACGPIACFAALRILGFQTSLDEIVAKCNWQEGQMISLQAMHDAILSVDDALCVPAKLTPEKLCEYLTRRKYVTILPIRKFSQEIDHAVVGIGIKEGRIAIMDYPELGMEIDIDALSDVWDGQVLLVSRRSKSRTASTLLVWLAICIPGIILSVIGSKIILAKIRRRQVSRSCLDS